MVAEDRRTIYASVRAVWAGLPVPVWGATDCCCWPLAVIDALQGRAARTVLDLPYWTSRTTAARLIHQSGASSLSEMVELSAQKLGLRRVYTPMAQAGDLCLIQTVVTHGVLKGFEISAPAIVDTGGRNAALLRLDDEPGLVAVGQAHVRKVWRVEPCQRL